MSEKIVTMTCCGSRYETVAETVGHVCGDEAFRKLESAAIQAKAARQTRDGILSGQTDAGFSLAKAEENLATRVAAFETAWATVEEAGLLAAYGEWRKTN